MSQARLDQSQGRGFYYTTIYLNNFHFPPWLKVAAARPRLSPTAGSAVPLQSTHEPQQLSLTGPVRVVAIAVLAQRCDPAGSVTPAKQNPVS